MRKKSNNTELGLFVVIKIKICYTENRKKFHTGGGFVIKKAIVTDVRYRMSLPVIRSLGRCGIEVISTERRGSKPEAALGFYSKYSTQNEFLTDQSESVDGFIADLSSLSEDFGEKPVIIPVGITTILTLCEKREEVLEFADVALPPYDSIELANDKSRLIPFAESVGIPVPETTFLKDGESIETLAERISYPSVIKLPTGEMLGLPPEKRYAIVKDRQEFIKKYTEFSAYGGDILVQQYITGDGYGVSAVFDKNSKPLEVFCHKRLREYPATGGPSCFCESVFNKELAEYALKLLSALRWEGVAMVEFKGSPETGFYLMEINPRFWGSSALAPNSGCNMAHALYRAACGETAEGEYIPAPNYKVGHRMRFLIQDLLAFPAYLKSSKNKLSFALSFLFGLLNPKISDGVLDVRDIRSSWQYLSCALKKRDSIVR